MRISSVSLVFSPLEVRLYVWRGSALSSNNEVKRVKACLLPSLLCVLSLARYNVTRIVLIMTEAACVSPVCYSLSVLVTLSCWRWVIPGASVSFLSVYTVQLVLFVWLWQPESYRVALLAGKWSRCDNFAQIFHEYFEFKWTNHATKMGVSRWWF